MERRLFTLRSLKQFCHHLLLRSFQAGTTISSPMDNMDTFGMNFITSPVATILTGATWISLPS
jgi:hypothetical protein